MGKKYIIELENKSFKSGDEVLWRVKGFKSLVFDKNGLSKLTPYNEHHRQEKTETFCIGDEVENIINRIRFIVTSTTGGSVSGFDKDGYSRTALKCDVIKTGDHFDSFKRYLY